MLSYCQAIVDGLHGVKDILFFSYSSLFSSSFWVSHPTIVKAGLHERLTSLIPEKLESADLAIRFFLGIE
jgi:hypothetical protein